MSNEQSTLDLPSGDVISSDAVGNIKNPYLKLKNKTTAAPVQTSIANLLQSHSPDQSLDETKESEAIKAFQTSAKEPSTNENKDKDQTGTKDSIEAPSTKPPCQNVDREVSIEHRLPSRVVSFQSAEHLSVKELRSFISLFNDKSVRITGLVRHRHVVESDASVCLVLEDPLAGLEAANKKRFSTGSTISNWTLTSDKSQATPVTINNQKSHLISTDKRTLGPARTPANRTPFHERKSQSFSGGTLSTSSSSSLGKRKLVKISKTLSLSQGNKRRLSFSTPTESAINSLLHHQTILVILTPQQHSQVTNCGVGDLVMVIGEVGLSHESDSVAASFLQECRQHLSDVRYIKPRVVRNVNGTNTRLQQEALLLRREHVLQLSQRNPQQPGRGPPRIKNPSSATADY